MQIPTIPTIPTIPAESAKPCDCCGRIHRKLTLLDGFWMGDSCTDHYRMFLRHGPNAPVWHGWEKQLAKLKRMIVGVPPRG